MSAQNDILVIGNPTLLQRSMEITTSEFHSTELQQLIDYMIEIMKKHDGVGLAAPQIGEFKRLFIYGFENSPRYPDQTSIPLTIVINPTIEIIDDTICNDWEGCLSVPNMRGLVPRYKRIKYTAQDTTGATLTGHAEDFHARVIQHELDHLDGILFPQRIKDMRYFGYEDQDLENIQPS